MTPRSTSAGDGFSRREGQIMDILYRLGRAGASEVREQMPDPPSYSAVRAHLRILEDKGHVRHEQEGPRYVFLPTVPRRRARKKALQRLLENFFDGSREEMIATLLDARSTKIPQDELERLAELIDEARREGR